MYSFLNLVIVYLEVLYVRYCRGYSAKTPPRRGPGTKQRVHGCGCTCAGPRCACQSPHWEPDQEGVGGARQEGNSSSQRCCRPSCRVGCHRWTLTSASDHPATQPSKLTAAASKLTSTRFCQVIIKDDKSPINVSLNKHLVILVGAGLWQFISLKHLFRQTFLTLFLLVQGVGIKTCTQFVVPEGAGSQSKEL